MCEGGGRGSRPAAAGDAGGCRHAAGSAPPPPPPSRAPAPGSPLFAALSLSSYCEEQSATESSTAFKPEKNSYVLPGELHTYASSGSRTTAPQPGSARAGRRLRVRQEVQLAAGGAELGGGRAGSGGRAEPAGALCLGAAPRSSGARRSAPSALPAPRWVLRSPLGGRWQRFLLPGWGGGGQF